MSSRIAQHNAAPDVKQSPAGMEIGQAWAAWEHPLAHAPDADGYRQDSIFALGNPSL